MLFDFWANADFLTLLQSMFMASLKHFFCPCSVRMPIVSCPLGNCLDNLLSAILFTRPVYWNWITISMTFPPVYWQCSGPSLMQIILPFNFKYSIQGELPRNWISYQWQAWPHTAQRSRILYSQPGPEFSIRISWKNPELVLSQSLSPFFSTAVFLYILLAVTPSVFSHLTNQQGQGMGNKLLNCHDHK